MTPEAPNGIATVADISQIERVPLAHRALPANSHAVLTATAARWPDKPALHYFETVEDIAHPATLSYSALLAEINRTANLLRHEGLGRGDVMAYLLPNLPETHMLIWGGEAAGVVLAVNPALGVDDIQAILTQARARILAAYGPAPGSDIWQKAVAVAPRVPSLGLVLRVGPGSAEDHAGPVPIRDFATARAAMPPDLNLDPPGADELSSYFCTGGTTGLPKIARRRHGAEVFDAWAVAAHCPQIFNEDTVAFCGLPLFHVNAQLITGLAIWMQGGTVVLGTPAGYRTPDLIKRFWQIVSHYRITSFSGVPTIYAALISEPVGEHEISSLAFGICGAAPMPTQLFRQFQKATGLRILEGYGLTEGTCVSSINPAAGERRIGSIGLRIPYQQMRVASLDAEGAFIGWCSTDEVGSLLLEGPNVFEGYVDPDQTAASWVTIEGQRWFNTGDLGRQDQDGYFWLTGRRKDLIIRGGHNIDPAIIEAAAHAQPSVALAAAVGRPDGHAGEVPVLYVQPRPGLAVDPSVLLTAIAGSIGESAARPKALHLVEAIPLTAVGKIFKPALVMREIEDILRECARVVGVELSRLEVLQEPSGRILARIALPVSDLPRMRDAVAGFSFACDFVVT